MWANICALMGDANPSIAAVQLRTRVGHGTVQRIKDGGTSIGLNVLDTIADALDVPPWMLLVEGLDPQALPTLSNDPQAWPFPMVEQASYRQLDASNRAFVQGKLDQAIHERLAATRKRQAPGRLTGNVHTFAPSTRVPLVTRQCTTRRYPPAQVECIHRRWGLF